MDDYKFLDRLVHNIAFMSPSVQLVAADIEQSIFHKKYKDIAVSEPIFITSLPRAGTTLLLECFNVIPNFATNLYRDMPFVTAPIIWNALSGRFKKETTLKERAHGDGMKVSYDSPEAFEEVLWKLYWQEKYTEKYIGLWDAKDNSSEFFTNYLEYMQKIIYVRLGNEAKKGHYVSKNNTNIAKIDYLKQIFPYCKIIVILRHPVDHAVSMMKQYHNFKQQHEKESFTKKYMSDICHYEFGSLHKPINFEGMQSMVEKYQPDSLEYWLTYWLIAFKYISKVSNNIILLSYEKSCDDGLITMNTLYERLNLPKDPSIKISSGLFRPSKSYNMEGEVKNADLLNESLALYDDLIKLSVV